jgi:hypothetical protein
MVHPLIRATAVLATLAALALAASSNASAAAPAGPQAAVVGSWALPDVGAGPPANGKGGHGGGPLYSDGTMGGGGHVVLPDGTQYDLVAGRWNPTVGDLGSIDLHIDVANADARRTFDFLDLPVNTRPFFLDEHGFRTLIILRLRQP